jgi:hypothetical protein
MRWETGRVPQWNQVSSFAIRTRGPAKFCIDQIVFHDDDVLQFADYSVEDLASLAFGQNRPAARVVEEAGFWLLTDELQLDVQALQARLSEVLAAMQHDLALADGPLPRLIVFSRDADYRRLWSDLPNGWGPVPARQPRTAIICKGLPLSSWDAAQGSLRQFYTHEFCLACEFSGWHDSSKSDWWQEGWPTTINFAFILSRICRKLCARFGFGAASDALGGTVCWRGDVPLDRTGKWRLCGNAGRT